MVGYVIRMLANCMRAYTNAVLSAAILFLLGYHTSSSHTGKWFSGEVVSTDIDKASDGKVCDWMTFFLALVLRHVGYINVLTLTC